jgi:hypothetical protein
MIKAGFRKIYLFSLKFKSYVQPEGWSCSSGENAGRASKRRETNPQQFRSAGAMSASGLAQSAARELTLSEAENTGRENLNFDPKYSIKGG